MEREETIRRKSRARKKKRGLSKDVSSNDVRAEANSAVQLVQPVRRIDCRRQMATNSKQKTIIWYATHAQQSRNANTPSLGRCFFSRHLAKYTQEHSSSVSHLFFKFPLAALSGHQEIPTRLRGVRAHNLKNGPTCDEANEWRCVSYEAFVVLTPCSRRKPRP